MLGYQHPDATMTLRQGIDEYFASDATLTDPDTCTPGAAELFRRHDAIHVLFGTNRDIVQEAWTDAWTLFGTTAGWRDFMAYTREPEVVGVIGEIGYWETFVGSLRSVPGVFRIWRRSKQMREPWPWDAYAQHYDEPLDALRERYGISLL